MRRRPNGRPNLAPFCLGFVTALLFSALRHRFRLNAQNELSNTLALGQDRQDHHFSQRGDRGGVGGGRKKVVALIGVQTGFTTDRSNPKYDYGARRRALRATWFPASQAALDELEQSTGIVVRFVIGHSTTAGAEAEIAAEEAAHGGFLRLPMTEGYSGLTNKTLTYLRTALERYDAQYIFKADDDVYLRLDRVPPAVLQWAGLGADYIGCMKTGPIFKSPNLRWYEPQYAILGGQSYFTHCWGTVYVLSGAAAASVAAMPLGSMRFFANEDVTVGSWMLAFNVRHYDDRRLCATACTDSSIAVYDMPQCAGLCDAAARLPELHASPQCNTPATDSDGTLPMLPSAINFDVD